MAATIPFSHRLAVVFDFDETLIPDDSFKVLLASLGCWSRRINREHRLVDRVLEDRIRIIACRYHY